VSALVASYVPVSWEEQLGRSIAERLAPRGKHCTNATLSQAIHSITKTLTAPLSPTGYSFQVIVIDDPLVNAFAAPGGYIVVFRGLLERTRTPEQLAGVLAHEIQHIVHQHATRALLQNASTDLLLAAMTGSVSTAHGLEGTRTLGLLRYSRQHENEADTEALKLLISAKVDPVGLTGFFVELGAEDRKSSGLRTYLSTHPSSEDRVTNLLSLERQWIYQPVKLLKDADWGKIRNLC
jgi:predicted Zn-dependent protease